MRDEVYKNNISDIHYGLLQEVLAKTNNNNKIS